MITSLLTTLLNFYLRIPLRVFIAIIITLFLTLYVEYTREISRNEIDKLTIISYNLQLSKEDKKLSNKIIEYSNTGDYIQYWEYVDILLKYKDLKNGKF